MTVLAVLWPGQLPWALLHWGLPERVRGHVVDNVTWPGRAALWPTLLNTLLNRTPMN